MRGKTFKSNFIAKAILWIVTLFYGYGALVHILNMAGMSGFDWLNAPVKWQVLDIVYLLLDLTVVVGLIRIARVSVAAFYIAAISQIILYTIFRKWVIDVPENYAVSPDQESYLSVLVIFHVITLVLVTWAIRTRRKTKIQ